MKAKSIQAHSIDELRTALTKALEDGYQPTVALVFLAIDLDMEAARLLFNEFGIKIFGANAGGEISDDSISENSASVLSLDLDEEAFILQLSDIGEGYEREVTGKMAAEAKRKFENPAFMIVGSGVDTSGEELLAGFSTVLGEDVDVFGAIAGTKLGSYQNAVFTNEGISDRGVLSMAMDGDRIKISGRATCGWQAVGAERVVTKGDGFWVYEIDGQPALDVMIKYFGIKDFNPDDLEEWLMKNVELPLQLLRENGPPVLRPPLTFDAENRGVLSNGSIPVGSRLKFTLPPDDDVVDIVIDACRDLHETDAREADAIVYFSCMARILSLGPLMKREIVTVHELWNAPLAGFFSMGEMARLPGGNLEMNNMTSCCVVLKEK